jgi:VanZ family protein
MKTKSFFHWKLPALLWGVIILALTSYPKLKIPDIGFNAIDKVAHLCVYAVFGFLIIRAIIENQTNTSHRDYFRTGFYGTAFSIFDELHQKYIPGRFCDVWDATADIIGIFLGMLIFYLTMKQLYKKLLIRMKNHVS